MELRPPEVETHSAGHQFSVIIENVYQHKSIILSPDIYNLSQQLVKYRNSRSQFFFKLGFTPCKAEKPLRGMELKEKEA